MDPYLAGRIDDCIDWWHTDPTDESLPQYLGMDDDEYGYWQRTGDVAATIAAMDGGSVYYWPRAGNCWVCGDAAHYLDLDFHAPVCGGTCIWAGWEAMRLNDTAWRAW